MRQPSTISFGRIPRGCVVYYKILYIVALFKKHCPSFLLCPSLDLEEPLQLSNHSSTTVSWLGLGRNTSKYVLLHYSAISSRSESWSAGRLEHLTKTTLEVIFLDANIVVDSHSFHIHDDTISALCEQGFGDVWSNESSSTSNRTFLCPTYVWRDSIDAVDTTELLRDSPPGWSDETTSICGQQHHVEVDVACCAGHAHSMHCACSVMPLSIPRGISRGT